MPQDTYEPNGCSYEFEPYEGEVFPDIAVKPPPYALIHAPVLNQVGTTYAGYLQYGEEVIPISEYETTLEPSYGPIFHQYYLDRPFDLTVINPIEKVIYNPSEVRIENPLDASDDFTFVFPSGYTFKTAYGKYPSRLAYEEMYSSGLYEDNALCY